MNATRPFFALWGALLLFCGSCAELQTLREDVTLLQAELNSLGQQTKLGWRTALCSRDARLLLAAVQQECNGQQCDMESPPQDVLHTQVCKLDPKRRERFLDILNRQESEIFYLYSNNKGLSPESQTRLHELVLEASPLPTTRFLVVTRPWEREPDRRKYAEARGRVVQNAILNMLIAHFQSDPTSKEGKEPAVVIRRRRTLLWTYEFPLRSVGRARSLMMPSPQKPFENLMSTSTDAPADDERAVWVFRVDC